MLTQQSRQTPWMIAAMVLGTLAAGKKRGMPPVPPSWAARRLQCRTSSIFPGTWNREADRVGFGVMTDAGFESRGMTAMFEKLQQASRLNDNGSFPYLRSYRADHRTGSPRRRRGSNWLPWRWKSLRAKNWKSKLEGPCAARHDGGSARAFCAAPGVDALRAMVTEAQRRSAPLALQASASADNVRDVGAV